MKTKEAILLESLRLFSKKGFEAVSVRDIAGQLGITQGALYRHYKSKQDIFDSILAEMRKKDLEQAHNFEVPEETFSLDSESYTAVSLENVKAFTLAEFRYWTEDEFASLFRKMLVIEQYGNTTISDLLQNYLGSGVLQYVEDIFREKMKSGQMKKGNPSLAALRFYAPIFMTMNLYDASNEKETIIQMVKNHINNFMKENSNELSANG